MARRHKDKSNVVRIVTGANGEEDIYRPTMPDGRLAPIPREIAAHFRAGLPARPIPETGFPAPLPRDWFPEDYVEPPV